ncbi:MAG: aminopeptidase P family protein [Chloroflexi bacterium]|nr:aminopeptidase P family protein [Chloroflexota bacterium]
MPVLAERLSRLRTELRGAGLDALLVSQPESRFYLSGYTGHDLPPRDSAGYLLVGLESAYLLTDRRTSEQAQLESGQQFEVVAYETRSLAPRRITELVRDTGARRLGFESIHLPYAIWAEVRACLNQVGNGLELLDAGTLVDRLRILKDAAELARIQAAVDVVDRCFEHLADWLRPGQTERQVAREIERYFLEHAEGPSFPSIVASGPNGSMPHAQPTDRTIAVGEAITIDIGARVGAYCSDQTRTVCLGPPADGRLSALHAAVVQAQVAAECGIRPGMTGQEADALARNALAAAGYGEAFTHGLGHGIGLEVHEPPWLSSSTLGEQVLRPGMVFSVEPGAYLPGWGGVRMEDLVVLEEHGPRVLCQAPRELVIR